MSSVEMENDIKRGIPSCKELFSMELYVMKYIGLGSLEKAFDVDNDDSNEPELKYWEISLGTASVCLVSTLIYSLVTSLHIYLGKDFSMTCFIVSVAFSMGMVLMKLLRLWISRLRFYTILRIVNKIWEEDTRKRVNLKAQIIKVIDDNRTIRYLYVIAALILNACYALRPFIMILTTYLTLSENETMIFTEQAYTGVVYPIRSDTIGRYILLIVLEFQISSFAAAYFILLELLFVFLTTLLTIYFMVLADEYLCIFDIYQKNNNNLAAINVIIERHCSLLQICQQITDLFSPIILSAIIFNGIDLCCSIFAFQQDFAAGKAETALAKNLPHASILIFQIIIYCNCAHTTTEQIGSLTEAAYNSRWVNGNKKVVKAVLIIMINSQNAYNFTAYGLFVLNRQQLTQIFNTTMSYFMLLRNFM